MFPRIVYCLCKYHMPSNQIIKHQAAPAWGPVLDGAGMKIKENVKIWY